MAMTAESARLKTVYELGRAFASKIELDELIPFVITGCREVLEAEGVSVMLHDRERDELYFPYVAQESAEVAGRLAGLRFPADRGVAGAVLQSGRPEKVDDARADPRFYHHVDEHTGATTRSILAAPLTAGQTRLGVIEAVNHRGGTAFSDEDLGLLETLAESIAVAIANARRFSEVRASEETLRAQLGALRRDLARRDVFTEIIAASPAMAEVFRLMESAAASSITVLIEGETGTGKELVARAIHRASARADGPFIAINCAAFTETLLESELFGHRRGAFTGAIRDQPGLFKAAGGGVILLDEVSEMPPAMQAKVLRVLQEGEITAVGDTQPQKVDVRVISATNRELRAAVAARSFREDLFYRVAAFPIRLPALRERREDIPLLATRLLADAAGRSRKRIAGFEAETLDALARFEWPGNVRQLQNEIERAAALVNDGEAIHIGHLSPGVVAGARRAAARPATLSGDQRAVHQSGLATISRTQSLREARAGFEAGYIADVLARYQHNVSQAARALGISRVALQKKMKEYGLR